MTPSASSSGQCAGRNACGRAAHASAPAASSSRLPSPAWELRPPDGRVPAGRAGRRPSARDRRARADRVASAHSPPGAAEPFGQHEESGRPRAEQGGARRGDRLRRQHEGAARRVGRAREPVRGPKAGDHHQQIGVDQRCREQQCRPGGEPSPPRAARQAEPETGQQDELAAEREMPAHPVQQRRLQHEQRRAPEPRQHSRSAEPDQMPGEQCLQRAAGMEPEPQYCPTSANGSSALNRQASSGIASA